MCWYFTPWSAESSHEREGGLAKHIFTTMDNADSAPIYIELARPTPLVCILLFIGNTLIAETQSRPEVKAFMVTPGS